MYSFGSNYALPFSVITFASGILLLFMSLKNYQKSQFYNILPGICLTIWGFILWFWGWKLELQWLFSQFLITSVVVFYTLQNIRLVNRDVE
jgi:hypothetical protein